MQYDEFEAMMFWALGERWKYSKVVDCLNTFKEKHSEFPTLNRIDANWIIENNFYCIQIFEHWRSTTECHNFLKKNQPRANNDDPILTDSPSLWSNILRVFGIRG